ncbi:MAG: hypothetical protein DI582_08180 [Azospirillum brasilense]|nr:MAG: hypothetical protein DI582_08180 [Azospirillum brasilense]
MIVIIGLLVGGVIVGQMLIENAASRATVAQLETYNAGVTTFRTKNQGIPGDLSAMRTAKVGLTTRAGSLGRGDGNSIIQNGPMLLAQQGLGHETALFWRDLWNLNLIPNALANASDAPAASITTAAITEWLPPAKIRSTSYFHVYAFAGRHYMYVGGLGTAPTDANGTLSLADGLTPQDAFNLDEKLDDGMGNSGTILAITALATHAIDTGAGGNGECLSATNQYNSDGGDGSTIACRITIRTSF